MRFLHQPVFSRIDKRKNSEISEYERGLLRKILLNNAIPKNLGWKTNKNLNNLDYNPKKR